MKEQEFLKKRRELAISKKMIQGQNTEVFKKVYNIYKNGFEQLLNDRLNFPKIDEEIENANLFFAPSKTQLEILKNSIISSKFFNCLNDFYVEKLENRDIEVLNKKEKIDEEVVEIVKRTYKEILKKDGVEMITYFPTLPERIVKNQTIVLEFAYGKNTKEFANDEFIELIKKQRNFIENMNKKIEAEINTKMELPAKILVAKII